MNILLGLRIRQLRNDFRLKGRLKYALFLLLGVFFFAVLEFFFQYVFGHLADLKEFPLAFKLFLAEKLLLMVYLTFYSLLLLSSLVSCLDVFFLSRDLPFLFSSPMPSRSIFISKMAENFIVSASMVLFFSIPVLHAYCIHFASSFAQVSGVILLFFLYVVSGVLAGMMIGLIIPGLFSIKKLEPVLSVFSVLIISLLVVLLRLMRPERFLNPDQIGDVFRFMGSIQVKGMAWLPFYWFPRGMSHLSSHQYGAFWGLTFLFVAVIAFLLIVIFFMERYYYFTLFERLQQGKRGRIVTRWTIKGPVDGVRTLWRKEIRTLWRTPSQWSQLVVISALLIVFILNIKTIPLTNPIVRHFIAFLQIGLTVFIVAGLNSRFTLPAIPVEWPGAVHILASPFPRRRFIRFKILFYLLPNLGITMLLFLLTDLLIGFDAGMRTLGFMFLIPAAVFLTLLAVLFSLGIEGSEALSPQHVVISRKGISYMLLSMIYFISALAVLARPFYLVIYARFQHSLFLTPEMISWLLLFVSVHAIFGWRMFKKAEKIWLEREY